MDVRTCFLQKPFGLKTLASKIREILEAQASAAASGSSA
jgi:hypothetical protein